MLCPLDDTARVMLIELDMLIEHGDSATVDLLNETALLRRRDPRFLKQLERLAEAHPGTPATKVIRRLREELPHSLAVVVDDMSTRDDGLVTIEATVYVERESQKGMVIGKGGSMLKRVGQEAREELETVLGAKVFLSLRVKVEKDWQRRDPILDRLGF